MATLPPLASCEGVMFVGTRWHIQPISRRATFLHCALSHCVAWLVAVQNTINSWTTNIDYWDNSVLCPIIANYLFDVCQHMPYLTLSGCKISKIHTSNCSQCTLNPPLWLQLVSPPPHVTCVVRLFPSSSKEVDHKPDRDNSSIQCKICCIFLIWAIFWLQCNGLHVCIQTMKLWVFNGK